MRSILALVITPTCLYFFSQQQETWIHHNIDGEDCFAIKNVPFMEDVLIKVENILNVDDFSNVSIQFLLSQENPALVKQVIGGMIGLSEKSCQSWQVFDLSLLRHAGEKNLGHPIDIASIEHIHQYLLPELSQCLHASHAKDSIEIRSNILQSKEIDEIKSSALQLLDDKKNLEYEILSLQKQISILENIDIAHLYSFMPLFYENFFMKVKPSDLSLLASTLEVKHIPSPFPEPDANTVHGLKENFKHLPSEVQIKIIDFAKRFRKTHDLSIRKEMRNYIYEV